MNPVNPSLTGFVVVHLEDERDIRTVISIGVGMDLSECTIVGTDNPAAVLGLLSPAAIPESCREAVVKAKGETEELRAIIGTRTPIFILDQDLSNTLNGDMVAMALEREGHLYMRHVPDGRTVKFTGRGVVEKPNGLEEIPRLLRAIAVDCSTPGLESLSMPSVCGRSPSGAKL